VNYNDYENRLEFGGKILPAMKCKSPASADGKRESKMKAILIDRTINVRFAGLSHRATLTVPKEELYDGMRKIELVVEGYDSMPKSLARKVAKKMKWGIMKKEK